MAARRHADHSDHPEPRHYKEPSCRHHVLRAQDLAAEAEGHSRIGSRLLHVPDQHRSDEESDGLFGCCGWVWFIRWMLKYVSNIFFNKPFTWALHWIDYASNLMYLNEYVDFLFRWWQCICMLVWFVSPKYNTNTNRANATCVCLHLCFVGNGFSVLNVTKVTNLLYLPVDMNTSDYETVECSDMSVSFVTEVSII